MRLAKTKLFTLLTLMLLCMGVFSFTAFASDGGDAIIPINETLTVNAAWVDGELLRINVTDINGNASSLALRLTDYLHDAENKEFISIQAVDLAGNSSGVIRLRNPFFDPTAAPPVTPPPTEPPPQSVIPDNNQQAGNPFTPDGTGTVIDNAHNSDGVEFFTIGSEDGNVFYLIIDRQRTANNVYFLNAVTEEDLISLALQGGRDVTPVGGNVSAIPTPEPPPGTNGEPNQQPPSANEPSDTSDLDEPESDPPAARPTNNNTTMFIIIGIAVLGVGGAGYYFKIVKGKQNAVYDDDEDDNYGYEDEPEDTDDGYDDAEDGDDR